MVLCLNRKKRKVSSGCIDPGVQQEDKCSGHTNTAVVGNSQLPGLKHFMFSSQLFVKIKEVMSAGHTESSARAKSATQPVRGMFIQSNVEDVCVTMRRLVEQSRKGARAHLGCHGRLLSRACFQVDGARLIPLIRLDHGF